MPQNSSKWKKLEKDICEWLRQGYGAKLTFRGSNHAIEGLPSDGFRSDGMLTDGTILFAVEVEMKQTHPDTNTGKYWLVYEKSEIKYSKIVLFQVYTPLFTSYPRRKELADFYMQKMKAMDIPIEYVRYDFEDKRDDEYEKFLAKLKKEIQEKVIELFPTIFSETTNIGQKH